MSPGIPMQVRKFNGFNLRGEANGVERDVSRFPLPAGHRPVRVRVGHAIRKMTEHEARSAPEVFRPLTGAVEARPDA